MHKTNQSQVKQQQRERKQPVSFGTLSRVWAEAKGCLLAGTTWSGSRCPLPLLPPSKRTNDLLLHRWGRLRLQWRRGRCHLSRSTKTAPSPLSALRALPVCSSELLVFPLMPPSAGVCMALLLRWSPPRKPLEVIRHRVIISSRIFVLYLQCLPGPTRVRIKNIKGRRTKGKQDPG